MKDINEKIDIVLTRLVREQNKEERARLEQHLMLLLDEKYNYRKRVGFNENL